MQEDFLHFLWKYKKFQINAITTTNKKDLTIRHVGQHNFNSGPDFFNAQVEVDKQLWAGNIEIHVKSSDWYLHNHENDRAYDNVILHVVWEHDIDVFRKDNAVIPTLQLKGFINPNLLDNYKQLFSKKSKWINCENEFSGVDSFLINNWLERLFIERLEQKSVLIEELLRTSKNDWEAVLFKMLTKNFGLKVNGDAFFGLAQSLDFAVVRKTRSNPLYLESLFFGQMGMLNEDIQDSYFSELNKSYHFLRQKFSLDNTMISEVKYFRLRPSNFPTIRLSQLASLYYKEQNLFSKVIETNNLEDFYNLFKIATSSFWETHYTFKKSSAKLKKVVSKSFVDLLLINSILPIKFHYSKQNGQDMDSEFLKLAEIIKSEKNSVTSAFNGLKNISKSALHSQALLQLKNEYCDKNKCLKCAIGNTLISK